MSEKAHEFIMVMLNPGHEHFKHITPAYLYIFLGYYFYRFCTLKTDKELLVLFPLIGYGIVQYLSAFRLIESYQFEMALQPEKLILFVFLERLVTDIRRHNNWFAAKLFNKISPDVLIKVILSIIVISSAAYTIQRMNHRFFAFKFVRNLVFGGDNAEIIPLKDQPVQEVLHPRIGRMIVPASQAKDIDLLTSYIRDHSKAKDPVLMFPEIAAYHFIARRPFISKFPDPMLSWFKGSWHDKYWDELRANPPKIAILNNKLSGYFQEVLLTKEKNRAYYEDMVRWVKSNYVLTGKSPGLSFYELKSRDGFLKAYQKI